MVSPTERLTGMAKHVAPTGHRARTRSASVSVGDRAAKRRQESRPQRRRSSSSSARARWSRAVGPDRSPGDRRPKRRASSTAPLRRRIHRYGRGAGRASGTGRGRPRCRFDAAYGGRGALLGDAEPGAGIQSDGPRRHGDRTRDDLHRRAGADLRPRARRTWPSPRRLAGGRARARSERRSRGADDRRSRPATSRGAYASRGRGRRCRSGRKAGRGKRPATRGAPQSGKGPPGSVVARARARRRLRECLCAHVEGGLERGS